VLVVDTELLDLFSLEAASVVFIFSGTQGRVLLTVGVKVDFFLHFRGGLAVVSFRGGEFVLMMLVCSGFQHLIGEQVGEVWVLNWTEVTLGGRMEDFHEI
jgi:hypothetical protein